MKAIVENPLINCEPEVLHLFVQIINEISFLYVRRRVKGLYELFNSTIPLL